MTEKRWVRIALAKAGSVPAREAVVNPETIVFIAPVDPADPAKGTQIELVNGHTIVSTTPPYDLRVGLKAAGYTIA